MKQQMTDLAQRPGLANDRASDDEGSSRVLVIQHDAAVGSVLEVAIGLEHDVDITGNLASAVRALRNTRYDVIVLDVGLPYGNALRVLTHIRHHLGLDTPVMFISGLRGRLAAPEPLDQRAYVADSFSPTELLSQIQQLLREGRRRPDRR